MTVLNGAGLVDQPIAWAGILASAGWLLAGLGMIALGGWLTGPSRQAMNVA